jgi:hypothetical protein
MEGLTMRLKIIHHPGTNDFPGFRADGIPAVGEVREFSSSVASKLLAMNLAVEVEQETITAPAPEPQLQAVPPVPVKQSKKGS